MDIFHLCARNEGLSSAKAKAGCIVLSGIHCFKVQILRNWQNSIMHAEQTDTEFIMHEKQTDTGCGEGAPVHTSAASARRRGPTLAVKLSSYRAAARRRDSERTDPRQLCQLEWRCARAGGFIYFYWIYTQVNVASSYIFIVNSSVHLCINSSLDGVISFEILKVEFKNSGFRVRLVCTVIHRDRFDDFRPAAKESQFQGFEGFGGGTYGYATSYQTAVLVLSSAVIADVVLMYAGDIVTETEGCQSQKDRAEQARCKF